MIKGILLALTGSVCGIFAGMGMGGGTLLIPALTNFFDIGQKVAQGINLITFLPASAVALFVHIKNKRVDFKNVLFMIIPALIFCVGGSFLALKLKGDVLRKCFGGFLILLAVLNIVMTVKAKNPKN